VAPLVYAYKNTELKRGHDGAFRDKNGVEFVPLAAALRQEKAAVRQEKRCSHSNAQVKAAAAAARQAAKEEKELRKRERATTHHRRRLKKPRAPRILQEPNFHE
jgi:hypothetical protein